jgi:hypothetical protein
MTILQYISLHEATHKVNPKIKPGDVNRNGQEVVRKTDRRGNDHLQWVYQLACSHCGHNYGANGSDVHERKCPNCQDGRPGLEYE